MTRFSWCRRNALTLYFSRDEKSWNAFRKSQTDTLHGLDIDFSERGDRGK